MGRRRDPNLLTPHLCRFCGERIKWGEILRLIRVDPDTPPYALNESACHAGCLDAVLRPAVLPLAFPRHWPGKSPLPDDSADIDGRPCAMCGTAIAPAALVRLRVQRPAGPVKAPEFDEQSLPLHFECLAAVSTSRLF
jgi:hypothetical protein